ncbi:MAG TPA: peptidylprolyl isomerase, partial [Longimicrobiales bacterium]|nr:peptidylprolyl isomerase [Longimicrobiales bacterium]
MRNAVCRPIRNVLVSACLLLAGACAPPDSLPAPDTVIRGRPSDGLLYRPHLQQLVELELRRDGPALAAFLNDPEPAVRARAAFALGSVQDTTVAPALLAALHDLDPQVRADAAFAVGQLPMTGVATPLFNALKVEWDERAQEAQLEALGKRCEEGAALRLFQVEDPGLRPRVARAMARCVLAGVAEDTLWTRLTRDLVHPDPEVREWAAYAFARYESPWRWDALRIPVRRALGIYPAGEPAAIHLTRALRFALDPRTVSLLDWWMRHGAQWQTRSNAAQALAISGALLPLAMLEKGLEDPSVHVRLSAAEGLAAAPPIPQRIELARDWLARNPGDVAVAAPLLELLAKAGEEAPVEAWFGRPDISGDAVLLAGIRAADALPGLRGVELLGDAAVLGSPRMARQAVRGLLGRWEVSRPFPGAHETYRTVFTRLEAHRDSAVAGLAREALQDTVFLVEGGERQAGAARAAAAGSESGGSGDGGEPPRDRPPYRSVDWERLRQLGSRPLLTLETERGQVVMALRTEEAPLTVDAIAATAQSGLYDGVPFHRVVPNFVAQGGDVTLGGTRPGPGFVLRSEFTRIPFLRGVVGMASAGKDTETTQFFITHSPQPHLDGSYTAFGQVVRGMEVVDRLAPEDRILRAWVTPGE